MTSKKQIDSLQQDHLNKLELIKTSISNINQEGRRISSINSRYQIQNKADGLFVKANIEDKQFTDLEQYSNLVSKQFYGRLMDLNQKQQSTKMLIERLVAQYKNKPNQDYSQRVNSIKVTLKDFEKDFLNIWEEQHFLVLNYRLNMSAKQLQRWSAVMEVNKTTPDIVAQKVQDLFK